MDKESSAFGGFVGSSDDMQRAYRMMRQAAATDATTFLVGESGTGKDLAARAIHDHGARAERAFLAANCGAIPPELFESTLFGHERGSFTGAAARKRGLFELADGGTLFLDEITEMPHDMQVKLLRVLEDGEVARVGGERSVTFDVRILTASNRDLGRAVEEGRLRADLLYRLYVLGVELPPLRERAGDVDELVAHFLESLHRHVEAEIGPFEISDEALRRLKTHDWPGNVRELRNVLHRAVLLCAGDERTEVGIDDIVMTPGERRERRRYEMTVGMRERDVVQHLFLATLEHCGRDKRATAEMLGISLKTVYNRLAALATEAGELVGSS
jgi:DNA-binding NtrC family response regulator